MEKDCSPGRQNRTIIVDFKEESTYFALLTNGKAFIELVMAFILSIGLQLRHKSKDCDGSCLTRHSHYARVRLNGLTIIRIQCTRCKAVFTVLPHFVLRYRKMRPEEAQKALIATHGGLSLEWCALLCNMSPMSLYRFICSFGRIGLVSVLTRCGLSLPPYLLADEKHSHCLEEKVYLPTIVSGRVIWHLGYTEDKSAQAFETSYQQFKQAALTVNPEYKPQGILTDGFESTRKSMGRLFPGVALGNCLMHATKKVAAKLQSIATSLRESLKAEFFKLFEQARTRKGLRVFSFGQKLRHFVRKVTKLAGAANAQSLREWINDKKEGWYAVLSHRHMPHSSTLLDQAHNAIDRKLFMMKGFHHPKGSQSEFITGLALLYNLVPYQRRAQNAGRCGIEVEGGKVPTKDWFLNLRILTAGGFQ